MLRFLHAGDLHLGSSFAAFRPAWHPGGESDSSPRWSGFLPMPQRRVRK